MEEAKVVKNSGETAEFSDGSSILRQRLDIKVDGINYSKIIPVQIFKSVFEVGLTKTQVSQRLENPESVDGQPVGSNLITTKVTTNKIQLTAADIAAFPEK